MCARVQHSSVQISLLHIEMVTLRVSLLFSSLQMDHWGWKSIRREEEKTVQIEFFDYGSIPLSSSPLCYRSCQETEGNQCSVFFVFREIELDKWFFSFCVLRTMLIFYMIITSLVSPLVRSFIFPFLLSIVRHSAEFCCPWRINKRWVCACRSDLSMCVCVYARQRFLWEMIHWTVVDDTRKAIERTNVHRFKLITKFDNKSLDQIERVRVRTYVFDVVLFKVKQSNGTFWYYLIKRRSEPASKRQEDEEEKGRLLFFDWVLFH